LIAAYGNAIDAASLAQFGQFDAKASNDSTSAPDW
jgi:hypothetical protein